MFSKIKSLEGKTLFTLDKKKEFTIQSVNQNRIRVYVHSTNKYRSFSLISVEQAYAKLVKEKQISQREIDTYFAQQNSSYTLAIIAKITNSSFFKKDRAANIRLNE